MWDQLEYFCTTFQISAAWYRVGHIHSHWGGNGQKAVMRTLYNKGQLLFVCQNLGCVPPGGAASWVTVIQALEKLGKINNRSYFWFVCHLCTYKGGFASIRWSKCDSTPSALRPHLSGVTRCLSRLKGIFPGMNMTTCANDHNLISHIWLRN